MSGVICDAQVHAPDLPHAGRAHGIDPGDLVRAMDGAGVGRAMVVPLAGPGETVDNAPALAIAARDPGRFRVMGLVDLPDRGATIAALRALHTTPGLVGIRVPFVRALYRGLLEQDRLGWFWGAAETYDVPLMLNVPGNLARIGTVAAAHPRLRIAIDHFGLEPYTIFDAKGLLAEIGPLLSLARYPNVSVKATALPCNVAEAYPFPSLHEPVRLVVAAFGARRVFWGSDLTRLTVSYADAMRLFTEALPFLSAADKDWVMGRAICEWSGWS
ncbi:MAG: amidohydrolase [Chloroflexota bacterium]|nr:amidohydrolase [Chloroflexota bacterium]